MHQIAGVSPLIDSCGALIASKAAQHYRSVPAAHRRWLDPEDLLQEALVAALYSEASFQEGKNAKFSTFLYNGLDMALIKYHTGRLGRKKRTTALTEIDAVTEDGMRMELPDTAALCTERLDVEASVLALARAVSDEAVVVLVRGLLCGDPAACRNTSAVEELHIAAKKLGLSYQTLAEVQKDEKIRRKTLTTLGNEVMLSSRSDAKLRVLECVQCSGRFTLGDVGAKRFYVEAMTCRSCYRELAAKPSTLSCFGAYDSEAIECTMHCFDRQACREIKECGMAKKTTEEKPVTAKKSKAVKAAVEVDDLDGIDFGDIPDVEAEAAVVEAAEKPVKKAKTVKAVEPVPEAKAGKVKPEKPVKVAKVAKAAPVKREDPDGVPPKEVGWRWPFKANSGMRWLFIKMLEGISTKQMPKVRATMEAERMDEEGNTQKGYSWPLMLKCMRMCRSGIEPRITHTWKVSEEGGSMKIYDVKCIVPNPALVEAKVKEKKTPPAADEVPASDAKSKKAAKAVELEPVAKPKKKKAA